MYKQGDERVFTQYDPEYRLFQELADELTKKSPNKNKYVVNNTYLDFGTGWKWTTISNKDKGYQALSPAEWLALVNETATPAEIADHVLSDKYNPDRLRESKSRSEIVKENIDEDSQIKIENSEAFKVLDKVVSKYGYVLDTAFKYILNSSKSFYRVDIVDPRNEFGIDIEYLKFKPGFQITVQKQYLSGTKECNDFIEAFTNAKNCLEELKKVDLNSLDWYNTNV